MFYLSHLLPLEGLFYLYTISQEVMQLSKNVSNTHWPSKREEKNPELLPYIKWKRIYRQYDISQGRRVSEACSQLPLPLSECVLASKGERSESVGAPNPATRSRSKSAAVGSSW